MGPPPSGMSLLSLHDALPICLPDAAVRESRQRIRAALRNCGYEVPLTQITINLAPADIKKEGSGFDLPMAMGILGRSEEHTSELQSLRHLVCRLLLEKKKQK